MSGAKEHHIGNIILKTNLMPSKYGDESLFFRHGYYDEDIRENPHWEPFVPKFNWISKKQEFEEGSARAVIDDIGQIINDVRDEIVDDEYTPAASANKIFRKRVTGGGCPFGFV